MMKDWSDGVMQEYPVVPELNGMSNVKTQMSNQCQRPNGKSKD
jgi:hypothetical protein